MKVQKDQLFVVGTWLLSRLLVISVLLVVGTATAAKQGISPIDAFANWDGVWYRRIATIGYEYAPDNRLYSVPFFPLFPLLSRSLMQLGLPFTIAACLINNFAFLGALWVVYEWLLDRYNPRLARWSIAALAWCPMSLYCSVTYTEGLFLLLSSLALRSFDRKQYGWTSLWGGLTSATRFNSITLIATFAGLAWRERRSKAAYLAAAFTGVGILAYAIYCYVQFGEPLAFLKAQAAYRQRAQGIDWQLWGMTFVHGVVGPINPQGLPKNVWHPVQLALIGAIASLSWRSRTRLNSILQTAIAVILLTWFWLLWGDGWVKVMLIFVGGYLLWRSRQHLAPVILHYGFWSLMLILFSGSTASVERYAYGCVAIPIAFGVFFAQHPRWGYPCLIYAAIALMSVTARFAQNNWVA